MKKKKKLLALTLVLCISTALLTGCSDVKKLYDTVTDPDFLEAIENFDEDDLTNMIEDLENSDWGGLVDSFTGNDDDSDSSDYSEDSKFEDDSDETYADDNFSIGTIDGSLYTNSFVGVQCDLPSPWYYCTGDELAFINNWTLDNIEFSNDSAAEAIKNGSVSIIMYAENLDTAQNVNITVQYFGYAVEDYTPIEDLIDNSNASLEYALSVQGVEDLSVVRSTTTFLGETVPCTVVSGLLNGTPIYEQQVFISLGDYHATLTVASLSGENTTQEILDCFSAY